VEVQVRLDFLPLNAAEEGQRRSEAPAQGEPPRPLAAYVPLAYVSEARQRIEIYRKLAQLTDKPGLTALEKELRDRFGPLPRQVELLLQVAELKLLAAERGISLIEVQDGKVMLTRQGDFVMVGNKFPRLARTEPAARLKEIRKLLLALY
jgi:transcription-repair coupling factor (superfamily II helicase)